MIGADNPHGKTAVTLSIQLFPTVSLKVAFTCQVLHVPKVAFRKIQGKGVKQHWVLMQGFSINCPLEVKGRNCTMYKFLFA